jgi:hypothetical protein
MSLLHLSSRTIASAWRRLVAVPLLLVLAGCGVSQPFNSYDPPPTFAFKHLAAYSSLTSTYVGSRLDGFYAADAVSPQFTAQGYVSSFQGVFAPFGRWTTINGARWPANWRINAVGGCGVGTGDNITVLHKMFETVCTPRPNIPSLSPSSFSADSPPGYLTVTFNPSDVPAWTGVEVWIVDPNSETVISSNAGSLDGNASMQIPTPSLGPGEYRVLVDVDLDDADGGDVTLTVTGGGSSNATILNGGATLYPGQSASSPNGRFVLSYQYDGNFVLYDNGGAVWAINCWPECTDMGAAGYATIQTDGNLVVYNSGGGPVWHTYTNGNPGAYLAIRDDGALIVYGPGGNILWQR